MCFSVEGEHFYKITRSLVTCGIYTASVRQSAILYRYKTALINVNGAFGVFQGHFQGFLEGFLFRGCPLGCEFNDVGGCVKK